MDRIRHFPDNPNNRLIRKFRNTEFAGRAVLAVMALAGTGLLGEMVLQGRQGQQQKLSEESDLQSLKHYKTRPGEGADFKRVIPVYKSPDGKEKVGNTIGDVFVISDLRVGNMVRITGQKVDDQGYEVVSPSGSRAILTGYVGLKELDPFPQIDPQPKKKK